MSNLPEKKQSNRSVVLSIVAIIVGMFCLAYASVPLYRLFCQVTGFGGTTQIATSTPQRIGTRTITVQFDANIADDLPWIFATDQRQVRAVTGESTLVFYHAENHADHPTTGVATYNVIPEKAGKYFNKIQCFCFENQTLSAGQRVEMPISFFIDPAMETDPEMHDVKTITLSYTFFKAKIKNTGQNG